MRVWRPLGWTKLLGRCGELCSEDGAANDEYSFFFSTDPLDYAVRGLGEGSTWSVTRCDGIEFENWSTPREADVCFCGAMVDFGMNRSRMQSRVECRV